MRRPDEEGGSEATDPPVEEERLGELPNMRDMKARKARLHRKVQAHQMKELQEERLKMGQHMEGFLEQFQENQQQMQELERQVEQLKEREQQKASEIRRWQSSSDALQKDSLRLKRQLAVVTERLAKAEESAAEAHLQMQAVAPATLQPQGACETSSSQGQALAEADSNIIVEQLLMRLADYESLVAEFADQAGKTADDIDELEPTNLVPHFEDAGAGDKAVDSTATVALETDGEHSSKPEPMPDGLQELKDEYAAAQAELRRLSSECSEAEKKLDVTTSQCAQLRTQLDDSMARIPKIEEHAAESAERVSRTEAELQRAQEQIRESELEASSAEATRTSAEAAMLENLEDRARSAEAALARNDEERARLSDELCESKTQSQRLQTDLETSVERLSATEAEVEAMRKAAESAVQRGADVEESMQVLRDKHTASGREYFRALRRVHTVDHIVHDVHQKMLQIMSKAQQSKRESRRVQSEAVLVQQIRPPQAAGTVVESNGDPCMNLSSGDPMPGEGARAPSAEESGAHQLDECAASPPALDPSGTDGMDPGEPRAEAQTQTAVEMTSHATQQDISDDAQRTQAALSENLWENIKEDRDILEARIQMLQENLDEESEHFDVLVVTHEKALQMLERTKLQNADLQKQVTASNKSRKVLEDEMREVVDVARREIIGLLARQKEESRRNNEAFQTQLRESNTQQSELVEALAEKSEAKLHLENEKLVLTQQLERERALAKTEAELLNTQRESLEEQHRSAQIQLTEMDQKISKAQEEHGALEQKLANALAALDEGTAEQNSLRDKCQQLEASASGSDAATEKQLEESKLEVHRSTLEQQTLQQRLHDAESRLADEEAARAAAEQRHREALEAEAVAKAEHEFELGRATSSEHNQEQALEEATLAIAKRDMHLEELLEARSEFAAASAKETTMKEQLARMMEDLIKHEQELADAVADNRDLKSQEQSMFQEVSAHSQKVESITSEQEETKRLLDLEKEAAHSTQVALSDVRGNYDHMVGMHETLEQQLNDMAEAAVQSQIERDALLERLTETQRERDEAVTHAEHKALQMSRDQEENEGLQTRQARVHAELAESAELYRNAEHAQKALQDQLDSARQNEQSFQDQLRDLQSQLQQSRTEAEGHTAREQEDARLVGILQTKVEELQQAEANTFAEIRQQQEATEAALSEKASQARVHEEDLVRQLACHEQDRERAIASNTEQLQKQMHDEAQKYMSSVQEQARAAIASRDEQLLQQSQQIQAHQAYLEEKARHVETLEQELLVLRQVDGDALTERLRVVSAELAASSAEREQARVAISSRDEQLLQQSQQLQAHQAYLEEKTRHVETLEQELLVLRQVNGDELTERLRVVSTELAASSAEREQARVAISSRDEQLLQQSQQLQAHQAYLEEKARHVETLEQELLVLKQVDGDALTERLRVVSAELAASSAEREQARVAISSRDEQLLQQSQQLQAHQAYLEEKTRHVETLEQELLVLRQVDGDALTERLRVVSAELAASSAERGTLRQEMDRINRECEAASAQRDQLQEQFSDVGGKLQEFRGQVAERDHQIAALQKQAADELALVSAKLMQETSACGIATQNCQQLCKDKEDLVSRLQRLEAQAHESSEERAALRNELDLTKRRMQDASSQRASIQEEMMTGPAVDELRALLEERGIEAGRLNQQLAHVMSERDAMACQLQQAQLAAASAATVGSGADVECLSLREQLAAMSQQLDATSGARHLSQQEVEETKQEMRSMAAQYGALQTQFDARGAELDLASRGLEARHFEIDGIRQELAVASASRTDLEAKLADMERKLGESTIDNQKLLTQCREAEQRAAQAGAVPAPASGAAAAPSSELPPAFDVQQAAAEREALEAAFRAQMEQVQRSLSAKTIEAETLKHQLAVASASATSPSAAHPAAPGGADSEHLLVQVRQLQLRVSAAEEEKAVMLRDMREHILQLARENYDLKQLKLQLSAQEAPQLAKSSQDSVAATQAPAQAHMAGDAPEAPVASDDASKGVDGEPVKSSSGGWLSYVLSPFLTDSDMREIHAESYVGEALKGQPLATM